MVAIPVGFFAWSAPIKHVSLSRVAYITGGCQDNTASASANDLANAVHDSLFVTGGLAGRLDSSCTLGPVEVRVGQDGGEPVVGASSASAPGTSSASTVPPAVAAYVHKRTNRGGRAHKGRWYIPWCLSEAEIDEAGNLSTQEKTFMQNSVNAVFAAFNTEDIPLVILHSELKTPIPAPTVVTSLTIDPRVATQKRRNARG